MFDPNELAPGIRALVLDLRSHGFQTCDSGDGTGKMDGALPYRHVFSACPVDFMIAEAGRMARIYPGARVELLWSPGETGIIALYPDQDTQGQDKDGFGPLCKAGEHTESVQPSEGKTMKLYIAGSSANANRAQWWGEALAALGHEITHAWWEHFPEVDLSAEDKLDIVGADLLGIALCDVLIFLPEPVSHGATLECGYALALGKHVLQVGRAENPCIWEQLPTWTVVVPKSDGAYDVDAALTGIKIALEGAQHPADSS